MGGLESLSRTAVLATVDITVLSPTADLGMHSP